jgi:hypothetical protein
MQLLFADNNQNLLITYLMCNANLIHDFEKGLSKPLSVVCIVQACEP